jgi:hypothetical protein
MIHLTATTVDGPSVTVQYDRSPDSCPLCHTSVHPKLLQGILDGAQPYTVLNIAFQCTKRECRRMFIGLYGLSVPHMYTLISSVPIIPLKEVFPEPVEKVSPVFSEVYNQSIAAEAAGLHQLTGIGLRKALEFLIKDFAVNQKPDKKEVILKTHLGPCIQKFVDDQRIRDCAQRAAWLGNDETHYLRKWQDQDIKDLKVLLRLTVNWVESVLLTEKYVTDLPEGKN